MKSPSKYAYFVVNDSDNLEELKQFITPFGDVASMIRYWGNEIQYLNANKNVNCIKITMRFRILPS